jgi:hypothetical protein
MPDMCVSRDFCGDIIFRSMAVLIAQKKQTRHARTWRVTVSSRSSGDRLFSTAGRILRRNPEEVIMRRSMPKHYAQHQSLPNFSWLPTLRVSFVKCRA